MIFPSAVAVATGEIEPAYGGRPDVSTYETYGYYPEDMEGTSVGKTMEYAIADHALSLVGAQAPDLVPADTAAHLAERAGWWRNVYDEDVGFFHARDSDGAFEDLASESAWADEYAEGNARQYLWLVPHDPEGLFAQLGGDEVALDRLEEFFERSTTAEAEGEVLPGMPQPWYWHGNEVDIHATWLFALLGRPDLTRQWVSWIRATWYGTGADGLPGNDDGGTMSAWYIWSAMGVYPLAGTLRYVLGEPIFRRVEVHREDGDLVIERGDGAEVRLVWLDGEQVDDVELSHPDLLGGRTLHFETD